MRLTPISLAAAICLATAASPTLAQSGPEFKLSGYGTVGVVHSDNREGDFVSDVFQKKGAGKTESWSFNPDTKLGMQLNAKFADRLSAVLQVVAKEQYDGSYTPGVEWANVKYQPIDSLDLRLGRIAAPTTLYAESRNVGYSMPWVRPPIEVYTMFAITTNDGVDATWRQSFGGANNSITAFAGKSTSQLTTSKVKSKLTWGIADSIEIGSWQFRAGYNAMNTDLIVSSAEPLYAGLRQIAAGAGAVPLPTFQAASAAALALAHDYRIDDLKSSSVALGVSYDPGSWFAMSEYVDYKADGALTDQQAWYVSAGVRLGPWTPYAGYASIKGQTKSAAAIPKTGSAQLDGGAAALVAGLNSLLASTSTTQHTTTLGVRWDAVRNVTIKAQFDQVRVSNGSPTGRLRLPPGQSLTNRKANVFSAAVDFVF